MLQLIELERATLVEAGDSGLQVEISVAVASTNVAGDAEVTIYIAEPLALDGEAYPALAAVWDNDEDGIFDTL